MPVKRSKSTLVLSLITCGIITEIQLIGLHLGKKVIDEMCYFQYISKNLANLVLFIPFSGMLNLNLIIQVIVGIFFFHNTLFNLKETPVWSTTCLTGFVFVKYPIFAAIALNKARTQFLVGAVVGSAFVLTMHALTLAVYWYHSISCKHLKHGQTGEVACNDALIQAYETEFHLSTVMFALLMHFGYICLSHSESVVAAGAGQYTSYRQVRQTDEFDHKVSNYGLDHFGSTSVHHNNDMVRLPPAPQHVPL